ncbi:MAG: hypothetical protein K6A43_12375 [Treponema sp.]|nr:hypothetical protein [Treponema sp.]
MKKTFKKLLCCTAIFAMLFSSCDFLNNLTGSGGENNQTPTDNPETPDTPEKPDTPDKPDTPETPEETPETPNIFNGKTYTYDYGSGKEIFEFTSNTTVNVTIGDSSWKNVGWSLDEANSMLTIKGLGTYRYTFKDKNLLLEEQDENDTDIFSFGGVFICSEDKTVVSDASAATSEETSFAWNYIEDKPLLEVPSNVTDITIKSDKDFSKKTLYLISANSGSKVIPNSEIRNIRNFKAGEIDYELNNSGASSASSSILESKSNGITYFQEEYINIDDYATRDDSPDLSRAAAVSVVKEYKVGDKKKLWINKGKMGTADNYAQLDATLYAVGKHCYVWILDDFYAETASGSKVSSNIAKTYQEKFDSIYELEHAVFGSEPEKIRVVYKDTEKNRWSYRPNVDIATKSDTGSMVNIVIYDIEYDYTDGETNPAGTAGYFHSKDFYVAETEITDYPGIAIYNKTNIGKYVYMDSAMANYRSNDSFSTLCHEFNHMITCGMKEIPLNTTSTSTNYNEMLAMICEDMMKEYLVLKDSESPLARIEKFNTTYYQAGVGGWNTEALLTSYADTYVFGAWLLRQYGGAALAKTMLENIYINRDSIVSAVNTLNNTSYSYKNLFEQFLLALTGDKEYTLKQDAKTTLSCNGYNFPMTAIDIFDQEYSWDKVNGGDGPRTFNIWDEEVSSLGLDLQNDYGFIIQNFSLSSTGISDLKEIQLKVDATTDSNNLLYIIIE